MPGSSPVAEHLPGRYKLWAGSQHCNKIKQTNKPLTTKFKTGTGEWTQQLKALLLLQKSFWFSSQHPQGGLQSSSSRGSNTLFQTLRAVHTHVNKINLRKN